MGSPKHVMRFDFRGGRFNNEIVAELPEDLNAIVTNTEELEVAVLELDEQWSYVQKKHN